MTRTGSGVGIKDVARAAGVSVGTVSNVMNRPDVVSPSSREKVEKAIEELGYVPNDAARQLKAGTSRTVGLVVVDTQNPFYGTIALEAEDAAEERGLGLFIANSHRRHSKEQFYLSQFEQQRARGILVTPVSSDLDVQRSVAQRGTRVVLVDAVERDEGFCAVAADDFHGGYLAVRHLIDLGRRRITILGGPEHFRQVGRRLAGAQQAASETPGVEIEYLAPEEMSILAGRDAAIQIAERDTLPEAIFAMNDLLAIGALQALVMSRSLRVPEDVALIGYDDVAFCEDAVVPLSSIRQPSAEMGRKAIELLDDEITDGDSHTHRWVLLKPELIARRSTLGDGR
ncbi:LacI family DNA-binding transcriptional regulator [Tessaracoccus sp. ZS01]|uniref:LacI family DNA-binding transcriptional regulator n=1 Tax=Tessaracoccus sp. ZS01 TaxID=1906324 RepID=UPI00096D36D3|nr:LacI family DNA-binding transcriptional regulator [Tessaracoccus sp. ZS01]MCG6566943.1 LacI family transcriptional regulator [Tessaracoccus sp. ZS01]OMG58151.1 LacI family transcriptional regulator [Tessaracoccus sp. ZS01]